jgi:two-component system, OmpR family, sensor histidine kinase VicK
MQENENIGLSREDLIRLMQDIPGAFLLFKPDIPYFTILDASNAYLEATQTKRGEIIGRSIFEVFPENPQEIKDEGQSKLMQSLSKVVNLKQVDELPLIKYDIPDPIHGGFMERYWHALNKPVLGKEGKIAFIVHKVEDITDIVKLKESEKQARQELEIQQQRILEFFLQAPVAIGLLTGPEFITEVANPSFCNIVGRSYEELIGRPFFHVVDEMIDYGYKDLVAGVYYSGKAYKGFETPAKVFKGKKLEDVYFNFVYEPFKEADNTVRGVFVVAIEVTEQVILRREIEKREERLKFSLEAVRLGIWEVNLATGEIMRNFRHDEIFGYTKPVEKWDYETFLLHVHHEDLTQVHNYYKLANQGHRLELETRMIRKDNETRWVELKAHTIYDDEGQPEKVFGVIYDITERKQLEKQKDDAIQAIRKYNDELKEVNDAKDKFISVISHDLRNPLASIQSSAEIILKNLSQLDKPEVERFVKIIHKSSEKIITHLNQLVDWSKTKSQKIIYNPVMLNAHEAIDTSIQILESAAFHKNITIANKAPDSLLIKADALLLRSIIQNLVSNAIKFTPEGGIIIIEAKIRNDKFVEIRVKDSGIGIPGHIINDLFKEHQIISTRGTEKEIGTGLGLKLAKEFVEKHGGSIWVESEPGEGACFAFTVPRGS